MAKPKAKCITNHPIMPNQGLWMACATILAHNQKTAHPIGKRLINLSLILNYLNFKVIKPKTTKMMQTM